ncbi:cytochrome P450 6k1-like [Macrosteles quadrilineatus]|uniref:cytochrome P450 6k1-like n=1 Tax=Macrosteles quadrilineatus TaxID=74068 RepID=UPI0023E0D90F|nr:cytochrome P450 6k1-like [Macrosteles quadrilineatus]
MKRSSWISFINQFYANFKHQGFGGVYFGRRPSFWVCDPKLVEHILVEDFAHFHDRWRQSPKSETAEGNTLMFSQGEKWRSLRLKLSPAFTSGKVKGMFQQILSSTDNFIQRVLSSDHQDGVDVESLTTDFATEAMVSCLCGVQMSNSKEAVEFNKALNIIYKPTLRRNIVFTLYSIFPTKLFKFIGIRGAPHEAIDILKGVVKSILNYRKRSGERRNDILQTMFDLKEQEESEYGKEEIEIMFSSKIKRLLKQLMVEDPEPTKQFTEEAIAAQILGFMSAGIKPISVTVTFALFEIANNPSIQNKLHKEIDSVMLKHKDWNLEALREMTFLDGVVQETLRVYSVNVLLMRAVNEKYNLPGTDVVLEKDMQVFITSDALHKDPDLYPSPLEFRPERWQGNNYRTSSTYLPFGHGPRICISIRLAVLTVKLCLARVVAQHDLSISPKMTLPLQFDKNLHFKARDGVWLRFSKRKS